MIEMKHGDTFTLERHVNELVKLLDFSQREQFRPSADSRMYQLLELGSPHPPLEC